MASVPLTPLGHGKYALMLNVLRFDDLLRGCIDLFITISSLLNA
jgi:hypothetical protein